MIRRVFTTASALSLLLCVATLLLWVTSYRRILTASRYRHITNRDIDRAQFAGKIGAFDVTILRGRCEVAIEMDSAYLDDDGEWHFSQNPTFAGMGDIEVDAPPTIPFSGGRRAPVYRVYFNHAALAFYRNDLNDISRGYNVIFPLWFLVFMTAALPTAWLWRRIKARRLSGLCPFCGYDLRASTGRCPECGSSIPSLMETNA